jgi:hypothetical protein
MYLSAHLRQASDRGEVVEVRFDTWKEFAEGHAHTSVPRRLHMVLELICKTSSAFGTTVALGPDDFVLVDAAHFGEMHALAGALVEQQALQEVIPGQSYIATARGWERFSPSDPGGVPGTCFAALSFDSLAEIYDAGIEPAGKACGLVVTRADKPEHNDVITDVIHAQIRSAQVIVADVTGQNPGVYFEAGLALGLGRIVIFSCREDEIRDKKVHFDTRQYNHVVWKDAADLRVRLERRMRGTLAIPVGH